VSKQKDTNFAVLIVDMQNAYFNNDALREVQENLTEKINGVIEIAATCQIPVFNIRTEHQKDIATWTLNMKADKQGYLFVGEDDSGNVPNLATSESVDLIKTRDSSFHATPLATMLKNYNIDTVILCGVSTHSCIFQTAADAYAQNISVVLASEAIASHEPEYHQVALDILNSEYRQATMTNQQLKEYIQNQCQ
jgi:nicotinamidase-related amidase